MKQSNPGFAVYGGRGFHITFDNGCTVSVMFGPCNYCSAREFEKISGNLESHSCSDAEVAVWDAEGNWLIKDGNFASEIVGSVLPDKVAQLMSYASAWQPGTCFKFSFR